MASFDQRARAGGGMEMRFMCGIFSYRALCGSLVIALGAMVPISVAVGAEQWAGGKIGFVYPLADGNFIVTLAADSPLCPSPGVPKYMYVVAGQNGVNAAGVKNLYASVLAAHLSGRTVSIAFDDATGACYVNRLAVN